VLTSSASVTCERRIHADRIVALADERISASVVAVSSS